MANGVFGHHDFRLLLCGQSASTIGDRIVFVALALYVTEIGSPSDVGLVLAAHMLPLVAFLLIGGVWADRLPRHRVMIATDLIRFGLHALLAALIFTGAVEIWHLIVIEAMFGTAEAFFRPAYTGLVPQTVPEEMIQPAKAAFGTVETVSEFAGPALATALVLGVGPGFAFAIDAATFLVSAAFLAPLRPRERGAPAVRTTVLTELREGWTEVRSRTWVWVIILVFSIAILTSFGPWMTLGPTVSDELYDTRAVYGILAAALGAGTMVGALIGFRWRPRHPMRAGMLLALPWPLALGCFALGLPVAVLVPLFALDGVGVALFGIWWETALAERIPPHLLSRVTAYDWMGSLALLPIGYVLARPARGGAGRGRGSPGRERDRRRGAREQPARARGVVDPAPRAGRLVSQNSAVPSSGVDACAYRRRGMRPAPWASRPASVARRIARAIATGSSAREIALAHSTPS